MPSANPTLMVSPCGTSLFTNGASDHDRRLLIKYANASEGEIEPPDLERLQKIIDKSSSKLQNASFKDVCKHSAELHTISRYYQMGESIHQRDIHVLLASDTWLGKKAAKLVQEWLKNNIQDVRIKEQVDLTTNNLLHFHSAMAELTTYLQKHIHSHRPSYHVVFNLTGGFKGVQGFLQTLAMFYADEAIYIFQSGSELLRLPSLPIQMNTEQEVRENLTTFRRLNLSLPINAQDIQPLSEMFYFEIYGEYALSSWGELTWNHTKNRFYQESVWPSPGERIKFTNKFESSVQKLDIDHTQKINERIDELQILIETGKHLKNLNFKKQPDEPVPGSTHQFNVDKNLDGSRIFCHYEDDTIVLDQFRSHL